MAKLYFRYGVMGSSKTANALMVRFTLASKLDASLRSDFSRFSR